MSKKDARLKRAMAHKKAKVEKYKRTKDDLRWFGRLYDFFKMSRRLTRR